MSTDGSGPNLYAQELTELLVTARHGMRYPSGIRSFARRSRLSPATISRIFSGREHRMTRESLESVLRALTAPPATIERAMRLWEQSEEFRQRSRITPAKPATTTAVSSDSRPQIEIHGGTVRITDENAVAGKEIIVYNGTVHIRAAAARAAAKIAVHAGTVVLED